MMGDAYVEIGPQDADYARLAAQALSPEEAERRRDRWREDDEALRREFLEFARLNGESAWPESADGEQLLYWAHRANLTGHARLARHPRPECGHHRGPSQYGSAFPASCRRTT